MVPATVLPPDLSSICLVKSSWKQSENNQIKICLSAQFEYVISSLSPSLSLFTRLTSSLHWQLCPSNDTCFYWLFAQLPVQSLDKCQYCSLAVFTFISYEMQVVVVDKQLKHGIKIFFAHIKKTKGINLFKSGFLFTIDFYK